MVIFINGALGVGKTSVSRFLQECYSNTVLLEGDALCNTNPFDAYDKTRIQNLMEIIQYMILKYKMSGYEVFIVDSVFEKESEIETMNSLLQNVDPKIHHYLLFCNTSQRESQIAKRKRENHQWEMERSSELQGLLLLEFSESQYVKTVNTSGIETAEVGGWIVRDIEEKGKIRRDE